MTVRKARSRLWCVSGWEGLRTWGGGQCRTPCRTLWARPVTEAELPRGGPPVTQPTPSSAERGLVPEGQGNGNKWARAGGLCLFICTFTHIAPSAEGLLLCWAHFFLEL